MCPTTVNVCQDGLVGCCTVVVINVPLWQTSTLYLLGKEFLPALRPWICSITPQRVGLIDFVLSTLLLHTTSHPYHLSSTAQQQLWLSSQTIRTVHITTHDRHKLSGARRLTAYSNVPGALPGCQLRYQEKLLTQPMDLYDVQQSVLMWSNGVRHAFWDISVNVWYWEMKWNSKKTK